MIENHSFWADFADSRTAVVIYAGVIWLLISIVGAALATALICMTIEAMADPMRKMRAWLKGPKRIGRTIWA